MVNKSSPLRPPPSTLSPGSTVWAYLRDSGGSGQDRSVEQQLEIINDYCIQYHLEMIYPPFSDIHKSGSSTAARDAFNEMVALSASEHLRPQGLLIWNFARFARDVDDSQIYKGILRKRGILIHSLTDPIPEGPYANVIETLVHVGDEQKRREAAFGAWRGLRHIVKQGAMPGTPPRGFKRQPIAVISEQGVQRQAHRWVPDPEMKHRVRKAFQMRAAGRPLAQINKETRLFGSLNSYRTFFNNKLYIGILEFGTLTIEDYSKPVIPRSLWDAVQKVQSRFDEKRNLKEGSPDHPRHQNSSYLLSGLAECARCHSPLSGHTSPQKNGHSQNGYRCTRGHRRRDCRLPRIPAHAIEDAVIEKLKETILQPAYFQSLLNAERHDASTASARIEEQRKLIERDLTPLRRQISNLTAAIADAGHSSAMLKRLRQLEADESDLRQKLAELPKAPPPLPDPDPALLKRQLSQLSQRLSNSAVQEQRQILQALIAKIIIDRVEKHIYAKMKIYLPPDLFSSNAPSSPQSPPDDYGINPSGENVPISHAPMGAQSPSSLTDLFFCRHSQQ